MQELPAREKLDIAEKVAEYLVIAVTLDKSSPPEDYDRATELSLELAMLLPSGIYRSLVEAATHPSAKINAASVTMMLRAELLALEAGDLEANDVAIHTPGAPEKVKLKTH